jgi:Flp pilus assembly protein TadG
MRIGRDQEGSVFIEATVMIPIIFLFVLGAIDFLFAFYQWNVAAKAVQVGLRIAAVSDPVADGLIGLSNQVLNNSVLAGRSAMPAFTVTCDGSSASCVCSGTCTGGVGSYSATAMQWIVYGRGNTSCGSPNSAPPVYFAGMCTFFSRVQPANVRIVYSHSASDDLGYAGRPGGPIATIQLSLQNIPFQFFFLGGLLGFANITIPNLTSTITSEDLSSTGS